MLSVIDAAYSLEGTTDAWLREVTRNLVRTAAGPGGGAALSFESSGDVLRMHAVCEPDRAPTLVAMSMHPLLLSVASGCPQSLLASDVQLDPRSTAALCGVDGPLADDHDALLLIAGDGRGSGWLIGTAIAGSLRPLPAKRARWHHVARHLADAARVRAALATLPAGPDAADVPALIGRLRAAVIAAVRAESSEHAAATTAPAPWPALASGAWALIDQFEADDRSYLVALARTGDALDPRALSARELAVAERIARGESGKEIACELELCAATVSQSLHCALRKLRLGAVAQLAALQPGASAVITAQPLAIAGLGFMVVSFPTVPRELPADLSAAERDVLHCLLRGDSNAQVAAHRHTAVRTTANQVASIFRKIGVVSRAELAARLAR